MLVPLPISVVIVSKLQTLENLSTNNILYAGVGEGKMKGKGILKNYMTQQERHTQIASKNLTHAFCSNRRNLHMMIEYWWAHPALWLGRSQSSH